MQQRIAVQLQAEQQVQRIAGQLQAEHQATCQEPLYQAAQELQPTTVMLWGEGKGRAVGGSGWEWGGVVCVSQGTSAMQLCRLPMSSHPACSPQGTATLYWVVCMSADVLSGRLGSALKAHCRPSSRGPASLFIAPACSQLADIKASLCLLRSRHNSAALLITGCGWEQSHESLLLSSLRTADSQRCQGWSDESTAAGNHVKKRITWGKMRVPRAAQKVKVAAEMPMTA